MSLGDLVQVSGYTQCPGMLEEKKISSTSNGVAGAIKIIRTTIVQRSQTVLVLCFCIVMML